MRLAIPIGLLLVSAAVALSCVGQLSKADPMGESAGPGATQFAPGTVGSQCKPEIDGCQWLSNECASDPDCAQWYQCVLKTAADAQVIGNAAKCADGKPLSLDQKKLLDCLLASPSCMQSVPQPGAADADASNKGPEDWETGDTGAPPLEYGGDAQDGPVYESCHACIYEGCVVPICQGHAQQELCSKFKYEVIGCSGTEPVDPAMTQAKEEICFYETQLENEVLAQAHAVWAESGLVNCLYSVCSSTCMPKEYQECVNCQKANCQDALSAFVASAEAQDYQWCRTRCEFGNEGGPVEDVTGCRAECLELYPDGFAIVGPLVACKYDMCSKPCTGKP